MWGEVQSTWRPIWGGTPLISVNNVLRERLVHYSTPNRAFGCSPAHRRTVHNMQGLGHSKPCALVGCPRKRTLRHNRSSRIRHRRMRGRLINGKRTQWASKFSCYSRQKCKPMPLGRKPLPFDDPAYLFELKYDGFRALAVVEYGSCALHSRNDNVFASFSELATQIGNALMPRSVVLDGENWLPRQEGLAAAQAFVH